MLGTTKKRSREQNSSHDETKQSLILNQENDEDNIY